MRNYLPAVQKLVLVTTSFAVPFAVAPIALLAQDHSYHDAAHNDDHKWDDHENKAYRAYAKENHRKAVTFSKLKADDQQNYWNWRHDHSDDQLKNNRH